MGDRTNIYDLLLAFALVASAWKALFGKEAFTATVFFVVYGLFMSIAWVQLNAVDVALAEACIGAGLTGALFIGAIRQFEAERDVHVSSRGKALRIVVGVLSGFLLLGLLGAIQQLAAPVHQIPSLVDEKLGISGSTHPVTAVLLNFRAFDTWLELGVLLLASVAAIAIHQLYDEGTIPAQTPCSQEQPRLLARMMFPMLVLVGGVVLWYGSRAPGGAFQAGALLGAAGIRRGGR